MARCDKSPSISSNTTLCSLGSLFDRNIFYFMQEERISRPNMTPLICCPVAIRVVSQTKYETVLHFKLVAEKSSSCDEEAFRHSPTVTRIFFVSLFCSKEFCNSMCLNIWCKTGNTRGPMHPVRLLYSHSHCSSVYDMLSCKL